MNWINAILTWISSLALAPMQSWSPTVVLIVLSVVAGVLMTVVFRYTSDQQGLKRVASLTKAQLMCLRIFKEDLGVALRCQRDMLKSIGRRLWLSLPPMAVLIVPFVLILTQLSLRYENRPIRTGESVILAVEFSPDAWPDDGGDVAIEVPEGVVIETPALRAPQGGGRPSTRDGHSALRRILSPPKEGALAGPVSPVPSEVADMGASTCATHMVMPPSM